MTQIDLQALWLQANAHFEREELREAEALCIQLIHQAPQKPMAYALLGRICFAVGRAFKPRPILIASCTARSPAGQASPWPRQKSR